LFFNEKKQLLGFLKTFRKVSRILVLNDHY